MAMSVKLALLICMGAVGAATLAIQSINPPRQRQAVPLVAEDIRARHVQAARARERVAGVREDRRNEVVRGLNRPSWSDAALVGRTPDGPALAVLPPPQAWPEAAEPPTLPPLVGADEPALGNAADPVAAASEVAVDEVILVGATETEVPASAGEPTAAAEPRRCRVAKGDTLMKIIAREFQTRDRRVVQLVADLNPGLSRRQNRVRAGEELVLPDAQRVGTVLAGIPASAAVAGTTPVKPLSASTLRQAPPESPRWYTIQKNDSLQRIAERHLKDPSRWREIAALNGSLNPKKLAAGARIKLPPAVHVASR
jgi:nucleoid-associated protein YgaU